MAQESRVMVKHGVTLEQARQLGQLVCFRGRHQPWLVLLYQTGLPAKLQAEDRIRWHRREVK